MVEQFDKEKTNKIIRYVVIGIFLIQFIPVFFVFGSFKNVSFIPLIFVLIAVGFVIKAFKDMKLNDDGTKLNFKYNPKLNTLKIQEKPKSEFKLFGQTFVESKSNSGQYEAVFVPNREIISAIKSYRRSKMSNKDMKYNLIQLGFNKNDVVAHLTRY